jgi:hypothetical protein
MNRRERRVVDHAQIVPLGCAAAAAASGKLIDG